MPSFTAHNIELADGSWTLPDTIKIIDHPWFLSAKKVIELIFGEQLLGKSLVDFGCLEGGYTVEFARMGLNSLGIEINDLNFEACEYVKQNVDVESLSFSKMNVMDTDSLLPFDIAFVCGLLYHLDRPVKFLEGIAPLTKKCIILQTHFSLESTKGDFPLSDLTHNEGLKGRWFSEFDPTASKEEQISYRWAATGNHESFWIQRNDLIGKLYELGFDSVFEQFDSFVPNVTQQLNHGYESFLRGTFIGVKSGGTHFGI